jgi:hypothetical protein
MSDYMTSYHNTREKARQSQRLIKSRVGETFYMAKGDNDVLCRIVNGGKVINCGPVGLECPAFTGNDNLWIHQYEVEVL